MKAAEILSVKVHQDSSQRDPETSSATMVAFGALNATFSVGDTICVVTT